jgi:hypothetical protein
LGQEMDGRSSIAKLADSEVAGMKVFNLKLIPIILILSLVLLTIMVGCEPYPKITFDNQQNQEIKILGAHVRDDGTIDNFVEQGTIPANSVKAINITFLGDDWINRIGAIAPSGYVIFSHDYKMNDLKKIDWKIIIPP